jgi:hypothetical protein
MSDVVTRPAGADGQLLTDPICGTNVPADGRFSGVPLNTFVGSQP